MTDATDQYFKAIDIIVRVNNACVDYNESDKTGKDIRDFWSDMERIGVHIEEVIKEHNELMVSEIEAGNLDIVPLIGHEDLSTDEDETVH